MGERDVAYKFTNPDACVLEFGGGSGSVSLVVQRILENPHNHVVVQPADSSEMFGGYNKLCENSNPAAPHSPSSITSCRPEKHRRSSIWCPSRLTSSSPIAKAAC